MVTLKNICDLEYLVFALLIQNWDTLHIKKNFFCDHPTVLLKKLYKDLGFFREDFLGLLCDYRNHLDAEFQSLKNNFNYLNDNFQDFVDDYKKFIVDYSPPDSNDYY